MHQDIFEPLASLSPKRIQRGNLTPSAVLLPIFHADDRYQLLFIKRSETVAHHRGEISFPGGVVEPGDTTRLRTALRECHEEIGLAPRDVQVLGRLDDMETVTTGFVITPFVGRIPYPYRFRINSQEIATLIRVPLDTLLAIHSAETNTTAPGKDQMQAPVFPLEGHLVWGATARILVQFIELIRNPECGYPRTASAGSKKAGRW